VNGSNPLADAANRILHAMYVERAGDHGPLVLLVHGSIVPGWRTWSAQRPLAERYQLVVPHRTGYPPNPPLARIDFEVQAAEIAELIQPGTHVVGHSYGGVVALLAAALVPGRVRSLAVIEPPAFGVARGTPAVEELITHLTPVYADSGLSAREFFAQFAAAVGATTTLPDPLPPEIEASVQATRVERFPWEAQLPFDQLRDAPFPKLVFSGNHSPAFETVADVIATEVGAERAVIPGAGHSVQRTGAPFNERLGAFLAGARGTDRTAATSDVSK
jgi:pimeloyl-ACP methyl ester carboxylesterase